MKGGGRAMQGAIAERRGERREKSLLQSPIIYRYSERIYIVIPALDSFFAYSAALR
jgi:hypothetical protein